MLELSQSVELMKFYYASKMLILLHTFSTDHFIVGNIYLRRTRPGTFHQSVRGHSQEVICLASSSFHSVLSFGSHRNVVRYTQQALLSTFYKRKKPRSQMFILFGQCHQLSGRPRLLSLSFMLHPLILPQSLFPFCNYR